MFGRSRCVRSSIPNRPVDGQTVGATFLYSDSMPELPEGETIVRGLDKRVTGDVIDSVWIGSRKQPLKSSAAEIAATLEGKKIVRVTRAGKHIVFDLDGGDAQKEETRHAASLRRRRQAQNRHAQWIVH